ncbi:MAG: hypothetical protein J5769_07255 [Bacteroidales bacterium]|nr:hypothetical protein [Bacteroidales bacterium]
MKKLAALILCCLMAASVQGQELWPDGSPIGKWFRQSPKPVKCRQAKAFRITDYGAVEDSTLLQTEAIQKAINAAAKLGGTVVIPRGTWLSGALFFKPKTHLYLEEGAVLKGSTNTWDFPDTPVHIEGVLQPYASALINADKCNGFSIRGEGTLDGNGLPYWEAFWTRRGENPQCTNLEVRRPRMIGISNSRNVTIEGIKLRNAAFWNIHLYKCSRIYINKVSIFAPIKPVKAPSSDGIDLDACTDVHILRSSFAAGDDLIALKGGKGPWADEDPNNGTNARILVDSCEFGHGPGVLVFGSECIGAENVILRNSKADNTDRLLWLKMRPDTPQRYAHILVENVSGKVKNVVYIKPWTQFFDLKGRTDLPISEADDIRIQCCTLKCTRSRNIVEAPDQYRISGLDFRKCKIRWKYNTDEDKVKPYTLPDPLVFADGTPVSSAEQWPARRQEILDIFQKEMYGVMPPDSPIFMESSGEGTRRHVRMTFREDGSGPSIDWDIAYPADADGPVPAVMLLNYVGNDKVLAGDPGPNTATVFPIDTILARGYAFVTACYEDISPDPDTLQNNYEQLALARTKIYELWDKDITTGSLMAWAWALRRGMDMLEQDRRISDVVLTGSSRLGKAALLASAFDPRFAVTVINQTGGGGIPLSKRNFGEYVGSEIDHFGYWWCREFAKYAGREKDMPFDQHMLISCIAPRPFLVEGFNNPWFDTRGEFLALKAASPVWQFLGAKGLPDVMWPMIYETTAIGPNLGYVRRDGKHGINADDWVWMLDFADSALHRK